MQGMLDALEEKTSQLQSLWAIDSQFQRKSGRDIDRLYNSFKGVEVLLNKLLLTIEETAIDYKHDRLTKNF